MQRRQPLRRTPLARGKWTPSKRRALPARSERREAIAEERRIFVSDALHRRPWCQAHPILYDLALAAPGPRKEYPAQVPAVDVHETLRRSQGAAIVPSQGLDEDGWLAVCRACHDWIGANPREAVSLGLARWGIRRTL